MKQKINNTFLFNLEFPDKKPSSSNELDISQMNAMFQFSIFKSSSSMLKSKRRHKDKTKNYQKIADDFNIIRKHRNNISHAVSLEMTTENFNDCVIDLIGVHIHERTIILTHTYFNAFYYNKKYSKAKQFCNIFAYIILKYHQSNLKEKEIAKRKILIKFEGNFYSEFF